MNRVHVAAAVLNQTPLDWEGNRARIVAAIEGARATGARVVCLPAMCVTGYGCEDAFHSPTVLDTAWEVLEVASFTTTMHSVPSIRPMPQIMPAEAISSPYMPQAVN